MATTFLSPVGNDSNFTVSGVPASGYKLFTYIAGTTTKQTTYQDNAAAVQNANPILLNSQGYPASGGAVVEIWLTQGVNYKFVLAPSTDTDPPSSPVWSRDNISGINDPTGNLVVNSEWITYALVPTFISSTSFSVIGDQRTVFQVNRRVKTTNSGGTIYSRITVSSFGAGITTITVVNDSGVLDSGLSAVSYGILSATNESIPAINNVPIGNVTPTTGSFSALSSTSLAQLSQGRLTLTTALPVTITDVTAATTLYFTPYIGTAIALYDGVGTWNTLNFSELSIAVPGTTSQMYDVFAFNNSGVAALELLAWTNDTTRATALVLQNGVFVKTGATTRKYLGSFRTTTVSGQTEDSLAKRYVWNYYNRVLRKMLVTETTSSWNYTTATFRQANAAATNQLDMVIGISEIPVKANVAVSAGNSGAGVQAQVGIGVDSTSTNSADLYPFTASLVANQPFLLTAQYSGFPGVGRHFLAWLEISVASGTTTWEGLNAGALTTSKSGISGEILG